MTHDAVEQSAPGTPPVGALHRAAQRSPQELAGLISNLGRSVTDAHDLLEYLHRTALLAVATISGAHHAGVTATIGARTFTAVCTDDVTLTVDENQYAAGDGPCLQALRTGEVVRVDVDASHERWPQFAQDARTAGVHSFLAAPLGSAAERIGALNLYSRSVDGFDDHDEALLEVIVEQAGRTLTDYGRLRAAQDLAEQLTEAMRSRAPIEQAKGILMAAHQVGPDEAFALLRAQSQQTNTKLHAVAERFVAAATDASTDTAEQARALGS